jgi:hypothetical protein
MFSTGSFKMNEKLDDMVNVGGVNVQSPTEMKVVVTGYRDGKFCVAPCHDLEEAQKLARMKGLDVARYFLYPAKLNTVPDKYVEMDFLETENLCRTEIMKALYNHGAPCFYSRQDESAEDVMLQKKIFRSVARYQVV